MGERDAEDKTAADVDLRQTSKLFLLLFRRIYAAFLPVAASAGIRPSLGMIPCGSDINSRRPVAFAFLFTALATFHASLKSSLKVENEIVSCGFSGFVTRLRPQNDDNLHSLFICNVSPN